MHFKRTTPSCQRCKNEQKRRSYGRDRVAARRYAAGYAITGLQGTFLDRAGEKSRTSQTFACEPPRPAAPATFSLTSGAAIASLNGKSLDEDAAVDAADCGGANALVLEILDGWAAASFDLCGVPLQTSGAWTCDGAPADVTPAPGGAVAIGRNGSTTSSCSYEYDAAAERAATLRIDGVVGAGDKVRAWADGALVLTAPGAAPVTSDCVADAALAVDINGRVDTLSLDDLCGGAAALAWRCAPPDFTPRNASWRVAALPNWLAGDPTEAETRFCRADAAPIDELACADALDADYATGACAGLVEAGMSCALSFCPSCEHARRCDATCGFCPGGTSPPTSAPDCLSVSLDLRDQFGDGWNGATYPAAERKASLL